MNEAQALVFRIKSREGGGNYSKETKRYLRFGHALDQKTVLTTNLQQEGKGTKKVGKKKGETFGVVGGTQKKHPVSIERRDK